MSGHVTIARTEHSHGEPTVQITIRHDGYDVRAEMTLADYALAVTGQGRIHAETASWPTPTRAQQNLTESDMGNTDLAAVAP